MAVPVGPAVQVTFIGDLGTESAMMRSATNPLTRDPQALELFRARVDHRDWPRAKRLAYVLGFHHETPQKLMERDDVYLRRLERRYATRGRIARLERP